ncbi:GM26748 [Drosophila sechellia]|uniref:GM26748 n=1 Tax=Drosophila sechellia TaxID=7238 RepID=B4IQ48_DROSE|nr:GM26748 [Drosophila sechellia]
MPFGLHSASAMFQRELDQVIGPEMMPHELPNRLYRVYTIRYHPPSHLGAVHRPTNSNTVAMLTQQWTGC